MAGWGDYAQLAMQAWGAYSSNKAQGDAAKNAGNQAAAGTAASNDLLREFYNRDEARNQPFYQNGLTAQNQYMAMMGLPSYSGGAAQSGGQLAGMASGMGSGLTAEEQYLRDNPDVKDHSGYGRDPLAHYNKYGKAEGRSWGVAPTMQTGGNQPAQQAPQMSQADAIAQWRNTPGYQFGQQEGQRTVEASAAARGGLNSGATLKALTKFGQDYGDQQGYTPYMNKLAGLFGGAQTAAGQMGQAGQNYGGAMGQNIVNGANARGQSTYAQGQAKSQMWNDFGQMAGQYSANKGWGG